MMWLVSGCTGEYSDHTSWNVKVFHTKQLADDYCKRLNDWCVENRVSYDNCSNYSRIRKCPLDKDFLSDYTGTKYFVEEVEVGDVL